MPNLNGLRGLEMEPVPGHHPPPLPRRRLCKHTTVKHKQTSPETGDKLQMGYKSIMRKNEEVSEQTEGRCISFHFIGSLKSIDIYVLNNG